MLSNLLSDLLIDVLPAEDTANAKAFAYSEPVDVELNFIGTSLKGTIQMSTEDFPGSVLYHLEKLAPSYGYPKEVYLYTSHRDRKKVVYNYGQKKMEGRPDMIIKVEDKEDNFSVCDTLFDIQLLLKFISLDELNHIKERIEKNGYQMNSSLLEMIRLLEDYEEEVIDNA